VIPLPQLTATVCSHGVEINATVCMIQRLAPHSVTLARMQTAHNSTMQCALHAVHTLRFPIPPRPSARSDCRVPCARGDRDPAIQSTAKPPLRLTTDTSLLLQLAHTRTRSHSEHMCSVLRFCIPLHQWPLDPSHPPLPSTTDSLLVFAFSPAAPTAEHVSSVCARSSGPVLHAIVVVVIVAAATIVGCSAVVRGWKQRTRRPGQRQLHV
jgi:hypothetical protein